MTIESANPDKHLHASEGWVDVTIAPIEGFRSATVEYRESSSGTRSITLYGQTEPAEGKSRGIEINFYNSIEPGSYPLPTEAFPDSYDCRYFTQIGDHRKSHKATGGTLKIERFNKEQAFATGAFSFNATIDDDPQQLFVGTFDIRRIDDKKN